MPIGSDAVFSRYIKLLVEHVPQRVLDLGIGYGINATPIRNWNDWVNRPKRAYIAGVEIWPAYRTPMWDLYDRIDVGRIETSPLLDEQWDAIVMTDVIEHFEEDAARALLQRLKGQLLPKGWLLVSTPGVWVASEGVDGNVHEAHRSFWRYQDFLRMGFQILWDGQPDSCGSQMIVAIYYAPKTPNPPAVA